jgi:glycosyltransferase involved in cell wall biosynthesis
MARAQANVYASEVDAEAYRRFFPGRTATVVPNGVDTTFYSPIDVEHEPATLVFEGNLMFGPNVDTARRLALDILPRVAAEIPAARLVLVGRDPAPEVRTLGSERVEVTGTVADVRPYLARGTVFACPMRRGSGIKNKILQAWAMARPVVASTASLGGLAAKDGDNALVRDDDRAFAAAVVELMRDGQRAARLGRSGRETVEREYAWVRRAGQFEDVLAAALASQRASREPLSRAPDRRHAVQVRRTEVGNESTGARP